MGQTESGFSIPSLTAFVLSPLRNEEVRVQRQANMVRNFIFIYLSHLYIYISAVSSIVLLCSSCAVIVRVDV
jgi:hypothetical protein